MTILSKLYSVAFKNYSYKAKNWRTFFAGCVLYRLVSLCLVPTSLANSETNPCGNISIPCTNPTSIVFLFFLLFYHVLPVTISAE